MQFKRVLFEPSVLEQIDTILYYSGVPADIKDLKVRAKFPKDKIFSSEERVELFLNTTQKNIIKELEEACLYYNVALGYRYTENYNLLVSRYRNIDNMEHILLTLINHAYSTIMFVKEDTIKLLEDTKNFCKEYIDYLENKRDNCKLFFGNYVKSTDFKEGKIVFNESNRTAGKILKVYKNELLIEINYNVGPTNKMLSIKYKKDNFYFWQLKN